MINQLLDRVTAVHDELDEKQEAGVWTTRDGREIPLREMEQSHLENLLVWLDKRLAQLDDEIEVARERLDGELHESDGGITRLLESQIRGDLRSRKRLARWVPLVNAELARRTATESLP